MSGRLSTRRYDVIVFGDTCGVDVTPEGFVEAVREHWPDFGDECAADDDDARHGDDGQGVGGGRAAGTGEGEGAFEPAFEVKVIKDRGKY
jgi:hypothetical protein